MGQLDVEVPGASLLGISTAAGLLAVLNAGKHGVNVRAQDDAVFPVFVCRFAETEVGHLLLALLVVVGEFHGALAEQLAAGLEVMLLSSG